MFMFAMEGVLCVCVWFFGPPGCGEQGVFRAVERGRTGEFVDDTLLQRCAGRRRACFVVLLLIEVLLIVIQ